MGKKKITVTLSERGIDDAIKELDAYKKDIEQKTVKLRKLIGQKIMEYSQQGFNGAMVDDIVNGYGESHPAQVEVTVSPDETVTIVIAKGKDAVWVEFGAGVYHNGAAGSSPHPNGAELGFTIGDYGYGRGKGKTWGYYTYENGGKELVLTHGTPARMPMAIAVSTVLNDIKAIADEVFG